MYCVMLVYYSTVFHIIAHFRVRNQRDEKRTKRGKSEKEKGARLDAGLQGKQHPFTGRDKRALVRVVTYKCGLWPKREPMDWATGMASCMKRRGWKLTLLVCRQRNGQEDYAIQHQGS
ncbi:unnamed protein product [Pylaiella littoralis]